MAIEQYYYLTVEVQLDAVHQSISIPNLGVLQSNVVPGWNV